MDLEENNRNRYENTKIRDESPSIKDIEMICTTSTRGVREGTRDGANTPLPGIPSPSLSSLGGPSGGPLGGPLGTISEYNKPDSFYMLKEVKDQTTFDYNDDCPGKSDSAAAAAVPIANHMNININNGNIGDNDDECVDDSSLNRYENDNVSPSNKQFRLFNFKI